MRPDPVADTLTQVIEDARARLPAREWAYLTGGAETETTLRRERHALDAIALRPRVLRDVRDAPPPVAFWGHALALPLLLSPMGSTRRLHPDGSAGAGRAAAAADVGFCLASAGDSSAEAVAAEAGPGLRIYQVYVAGDDDWLDAQAETARRAGFDAVMLTVDAPVISRRERQLLADPEGLFPREVQIDPFRAGLNWDHVRRFRQRHPGLRLILKGILAAEDAVLACDAGVDAVYVSTHGGRQLDHSLAALDVLQEIVSAVAGRAAIIVDGGFRRGSDIIKARALGADLIGIGRLYGYGLGADGAAGVARVLALLAHEVRINLALLGVRRWDELDASYLRAVAPLPAPAAFESAFPLLQG